MSMPHAAWTVAALVVAGVMAGCSGGAERDPPPTATGSVNPIATPDETALDAGDFGGDEHKELVPEPTSAGPLNVELMPQPETLGPGWAFDIVDGDPHDEGFVGNDAATHRRDPIEVATLSVPFGCEQRTATELIATHVLDATYTEGPRRAVALRMRFDTAKAATLFLSARKSDLAACAAQKPAYDGRATVSRVRRVHGTTVSQRAEPGVPGHWAEVAVNMGDGDVILVAVPDLSPRETTAMARRLDEAFI